MSQLRLIQAVAALLVAGTSLTAAADTPVQQRQALMKTMRTTNHEIAKLAAQNPLPASAIQTLAARLKADADKSWPLFVNTGEAGSESSERVWSDADGFKNAIAHFNGKVAALQSAARGTDSAAVQKAAADLKQSCKACHREYKE